MFTSYPTGKPQLNRQVNRALILNRVRAAGRISRAELARITRIRPPTVTAVVRELLADGLLEETGLGATHGGRAPRMLALSDRTPQALGFEVSDTTIRAGLADITGHLQYRWRAGYTPESPARTIDQLTAIGERLFKVRQEATDNSGLGWSRLRGVGIALPGGVDSAAGIVRWSAPLNWRDVALRTMCEQRWGVHTDVISDAAAAGLATHFSGAGDVRNQLSVVLRFADAARGEVGVGIGLIIHGEPYRGEFGTAGELATPVLHPLVDARDDRGRPFAGAAEFVAALQAGQAGAVAAMDRVAGDLMQLVLCAVDLLEPGRLVIEADVAELGAAFEARLAQNLAARRARQRCGQTDVVFATRGEFAGVRGAVVPALQRLFRLPSWS